MVSLRLCISAGHVYDAYHVRPCGLGGGGGGQATTPCLGQGGRAGGLGEPVGEAGGSAHLPRHEGGEDPSRLPARGSHARQQRAGGTGLHPCAC